MIFPQLFAARANIKGTFRIEGEVAARKRAVRAFRLVEHPHVRFDPALVDQPPQHLGRTVARSELRLVRNRRNLRLQPKAAFSRFPPVHRADLKGQFRAESAPTGVASGGPESRRNPSFHSPK
jgi:hypothetical protein